MMTEKTMFRLNSFEFIPGELYVFSPQAYPCPEQEVCGIFDAYCNGRVRLEVVMYGIGSFRYDCWLSEDYRYVRIAQRDEIRDFGFNYGYEWGRLKVIK